MRPDLPKSTDDDWKFFAQIEKQKDTSLIASAWMWEFLREALTLRPECMDWHWEWRDLNRDFIDAALREEPQALRAFKKNIGHECRPSAWMISPSFPFNSISNPSTWSHFSSLWHLLPSCAGGDEANQWELRRKFYPLEDDEAFPQMGDDYFIKSMGCIRRDTDEINLIVPVSIKLNRSDKFNEDSFSALIKSIRAEFEERFGPVKTRTTRGKSNEKSRRKAQLKALAANRLIRSVNPDKIDHQRAFEIARDHGVLLYGKDSHSPWHDAFDDSQAEVKKLADRFALVNNWRLEPG